VTRPDLEAIVETAVPSVAPAVALAVWHEGEPVVEIQAGSLNPDHPDLGLPTDARFDLASLTKLFTTTAFLGFVEDGAVGLDDAVVSLIPEFAADGPRGVDGGQEPLSRALLATPPDRLGWRVDAATVTFRQLVTHTSGLAPWRSIFRETGAVPPPPEQDDGSADTRRRRAGLAALFGYAFVARPGTEFHYSDLGYITLGEAVARLGKANLGEVLRDRVTTPLGFDSVAYVPARAGVSIERIVPTSFDDDWRMRRCWGEVEDENAAGLGGVAGHAGLFATARDVAGFGEAWRSGAAGLGLGPTLLHGAISNQTAALGAARGLGWQVAGARDELLALLGDAAFGHTGFTGTSLVVDPSRRLVIALLTNRVYAGRGHPGIEGLRSRVHAAAARLLSQA